MCRRCGAATARPASAAPRGTARRRRRSRAAPRSARRFDPELVEEVGAALGREARSKGAHVLLAPTVNLHRTPIGGRNFECMSEDPELTARDRRRVRARACRATGVAACIKHFVANDTEYERMTISSEVDERTLRELYLVPFEAAVRPVDEGGADVRVVMSSYNRINGTYAGEHRAAAARRAARRVGLRRRGVQRLVRHAQRRGVARGRPRSRDARAADRARRRAARRRARGRGRRAPCRRVGAAACCGCSSGPASATDRRTTRPPTTRRRPVPSSAARRSPARCC